MNYKRPSWDDTYMEMCETLTKRSVCLYVNTACIIVDPNDHQLVSIGYNWPSKWDVHCTKVWCSRFVDWVLQKHSDLCRWAHAEINALVQASWKTKGMTMYTTYTPCNNCAKSIVNSWISRLVYKVAYGDPQYVERILWYLNRLWVETVFYNDWK